MMRTRINLSRRNLLVAAGTVAAGAIAAVAPRFKPIFGNQINRALATIPLTRRLVSLSHAEMEEWSAKVGSTFTVGGGYALKLVGVQPLISEGARPALLRDRAFAAMFDLVRGESMPGDLIYTLSNPRSGTLQLFLNNSRDPRRMVAILN